MHQWVIRMQSLARKLHQITTYSFYCSNYGSTYSSTGPDYLCVCVCVCVCVYIYAEQIREPENEATKPLAHRTKIPDDKVNG